MKCETCDHDHIGIYGSGRFCSTKCARSFSTKLKRKEINLAVSKKLKISESSLKHRECNYCKTLFIPFSKGNRVCSNECAIEIKKKAGKKAYITMIQNNNHNGWKARTGKLPSYPEQYFIDLFSNENIVEYIREMPFCGFFIDFAFTDKMIALEIDGKQHCLPERKKKDEVKDRLLINNGWTVFRIKWFNPRTQKGKDKLYPQIENFKKLISS
jgi:hypothetical protein